MRSRITPLLFAASVCLASFGYGLATVHFRIFPFQLLQNANQAWRSLTVEDDDSDRDLAEVRDLPAPIARQVSAAAGQELILVSGGRDYLKSDGNAHGSLAWIMDRQGNVRHAWHYDPALWPDFETVVTVPHKRAEVYPVGLHLYPDGGLLVSFQGISTFPFAVGLARFDKDSKLLWKRELLNHHWFSVVADGRIYACAMKLVDAPLAVGTTRFSITSPGGKILRDIVVILDPLGNVLDEIPVLDAVIDSGWEGLLQTQSATATGALNNERFVIADDDPTHLNAVEVIDEATAAANPGLCEGDLVLSMRHMNAVGILDPRTRRFKWMSAGATIQQHSPRIYDGGLLVLDNRGGSATTGGSRLVHIDFKTHLPRTVFPRPSVSLPGEFYTSVAGQLDLSGDGRVVVASSIGQKIWEIDLTSGQVLWEYLCVDPAQRHRRRIFTAQYARDLNFPLNQNSDGTSPSLIAVSERP